MSVADLGFFPGAYQEHLLKILGDMTRGASVGSKLGLRMRTTMASFHLRGQFAEKKISFRSDVLD